MFTCRSCQGKRLRQILLLGGRPPALRLVFCTQCTLVQITKTVSPEKLSPEDDPVSSLSNSMEETARQLAHDMIDRCRLTPESLVVDLVSTESNLLKRYQEKGIPAVARLFSADAAQALQNKGILADVIHANHVLGRAADLHGILKMMAALLKPVGVAVIETRDIKALLDRHEIDTIGPGRLCYFTATALRNLLAFHHLEMVDIERIPVHGGSLRAYVQPADGPRSQKDRGGQNVHTLLQEEAAWGVGDFSIYHDFSLRVARLKSDLQNLLFEITAKGQSIAAYGCSVKSTALLDYFDIDTEMIHFVAGRDTVRQTHSPLPILSPESLLEAQPDYVLLLDWRSAEKVLTRHAEYRRRGGRFILPLPEVRVL